MIFSGNGFGLVRAHQSWIWGDINVYVAREQPNGKLLVAESAMLREYDPNDGAGAVRDPLVSIEKKSAQVLMDDLWKCGIRPTESEGSAGSFAAQTKHLQDMRAIVQKTTGVQFDAS